MNVATGPRPGDARLLVIDESGISHRRRSDFPLLLRERDVVIANDAATLPASLSGTHAPTGLPIEVRLAGRASLAPDSVTRFTAVVFGEGDYRTPTEQRQPPPALAPADLLVLGPLRARVETIEGHSRLIVLRFEHPIAAIWEGIARHGRPIQYAYVPGPLALWDTWTRVAGPPVAFEPPSAGFLLDWSMVRAIRACGAGFATITHAAGISSTGDETLDRRLPFDEPYSIPPSTAHAIARARAAGGRVIAIGTTVVRALEAAADEQGRVRPGEGLADQRIDAGSELRIVDAVVSGMHEPGTSHYALLTAFVGEPRLAQAIGEADARAYQAHEFGDFSFVVRSGTRCDVADDGGSPSSLRRRSTRPVSATAPPAADPAADSSAPFRPSFRSRLPRPAPPSTRSARSW